MWSGTLSVPADVGSQPTSIIERTDFTTPVTDSEKSWRVTGQPKCDAFISHAAEDKDSFVRHSRWP